MMRRVLAGFTLCVAMQAGAAEIKVADAWIRGTVRTQTVTGAFMTLTSTADAALVGASSPVAGKLEIHEMRMQGGTMKMNAIARLPLPAGKAVALKPGGFHVMLFDLKQALKAGDVVPLTLVVEAGGKQESVKVEAVVRPLTTATEAGAAHHHDAAH